MAPSRGGTPVMVSIDQGTTNTKAALVAATGDVLAVGSAPVGLSNPHPGWFEQDAGRVWASVTEAVAASLAAAPDVDPVAVALSTQRESVVGWHAGTGQPVAPVIGWQDRRTASWCDGLDDPARLLVRQRTGLRIDAMFSAPKLRWLLDHLPPDMQTSDVRVGTVDAWLLWKLTGGARHLQEAGNAGRTLLYDITTLDWSPELLDLFGVPREVLPDVQGSDGEFGATAAAIEQLPAGIPILAVLADSHAALYGHGCTEVGMAKATYGTGSSVMTPVRSSASDDSKVPTTLAWVTGGAPTYALEGNILSSGATLAWASQLISDGDVAGLVTLAEQVPDSGGVTLVPAFSGLGAPHWDREAVALLSGMTSATQRGQVARAAVESIAHQICDIVDVMEVAIGRLDVLRADGGASASDLVMQTQADLLDRAVEVGDVAEVSAVGAAKLGWHAAGEGSAWQEPRRRRRYDPRYDESQRRQQRARWRTEVARARFTAGAAAMPLDLILDGRNAGAT